MAPGGENKDGADTQPKQTEEMELQHGPELWNQLVVMDMGGDLSSAPGLQPGPQVVGASLKGSSSLCYAQVPSQQFTVKVGAQQNSFPPVEETAVSHRGFPTVMRPGLSGSRTAARKGLGRRWAQEPLPAPTRGWHPRELPGCQLSPFVPGVFVSLGMMQRTKWG